jgi:hypothetical protein
MRWTLFITIFLNTFSALAQAPVLSPAIPVVNQGGTISFSCSSNCGTGGTWSVSGTNSTGGTVAAAGSINSGTGVYTAPNTVNAQQSYGGFQLLPNNHVFNMRIDSLSVNANSATWIAGAGTVNFNYLIDIPNNFVSASTPTQSLIIQNQRIGGMNGVYQIPAYPGGRVQCGWLASVSHCDKHMWTIDIGTGIFQELYQYAAAGQISGCPTCTAGGATRYANSSYSLNLGQVNVMGTSMMPLFIKLQELENAFTTSGTINHAISMTLSNGYILNGAGIWPAQTNEFSGGGVVPLGARFRLKSSFNISGFSAIAQVLLTQLKQYGVILSDGGYGWQSGVESTSWPAAYYNALTEVSSAGIGPSNFEAVDESGLMLSATSGDTTGNREIVSYTSSTGTTTIDVALQGVTVNVAKDAMYVQVGASPQQLMAYVNGGATNTVTWSWSPAITGGTLTSGGLFTPPATITSPTSTTVTATSVDNSAVTSTLTLWVFPADAIRIRPAAQANYTDSSGKVWAPTGGDGGGATCCQNLSGGPWPSVTDIAEYYYEIFGSGDIGDIRYDFSVPNGDYQITVKTGTDQPVGGAIDTFEAQGTVFYSGVDLNVAAGGTYKPNDFLISIPVTNGQLSFVLRVPQGNQFDTLNAIQINLSTGLTGSNLQGGAILQNGATIQ